jgi:hypothetical protein
MLTSQLAFSVAPGVQSSPNTLPLMVKANPEFSAISAEDDE